MNRTGVTQVEELGTLETPIALTGTLNVWRVAEALPVDRVLDILRRHSTLSPAVAEEVPTARPE